jgi:hypothetical protein
MMRTFKHAFTDVGRRVELTCGAKKYSIFAKVAAGEWKLTLS